jgi:hypothetical protein
MAGFWEWLASGIGTIILALLAGAGGSALLELLWRPRRDRRRAASLVVAEVAMNTELLLLQAHARFANPKGIPADFHLSTLAWNTAGELISELPTKLVRKLVILYAQYHSLNTHVESFGSALRDRNGTTLGSPERKNAETLLDSIIDVFNTGIDATIERGQEVIPELADLALIKESEAEKRQVVDYSARAAQIISERQQRIAAFKKRFGPNR